ncbi:hypothetical protein J31TS4_27590 [Paenibacillus sp. J31TS4]|uniref:alpha-L-rhamnosidase n=1 Tax=Paenibacillus sp. J31TS4 TaxID=2807195 RepID=UPI001B23B24D|nr:alpha-L-rhamnosidase [Paenibacillus sp. J31TS4]GIP39479.1 hypothetical protein J31TS4_27590 [Paenibacillus sp. J31TS4]
MNNARRLDPGSGPAPDWKDAIWIWKPGEQAAGDYAVFRKKLQFQAAPRSVVLYISAHHVMHVYINGRRISGYGSPAPSNPPFTKLYLAYDVTSCLGAGSQTLAATVHYLGGGGQNQADGAPGLICRLEGVDGEGNRFGLGTDDSWEVCRRIPYMPGTPFQQSRRLSVVERFDAEAARYTLSWIQGEEADHPVLYAVPSPIETANPAWRLRPQDIPEGSEEEAIRPEPCGMQQAGCQVFDAGRIVSGWVRLRLKGAADATVRIRYAEQLNGEGRAARFVCNEPSETYYDEYRMAGNERETWQPDFAYKAFRYFEITGYPERIRPEVLDVVFAHTPLGREGEFECSDPLLNAMFRACLLTQKNNVLGQVVDCPHREQAQYLADSDLQAEALTGLFEAGHVLRKVLRDFTDAMQPDGSFPFVSPGNAHREEFRIQIPEWDLHFVSLLWKIYYAYGDPGVVAEFYPPAVCLMDGYLDLRCPDTGLIRKSDRWHISDWPYPRIDQDGPYLTVQNAKCFSALVTMSLLAPLAGRREEGVRFLQAAEALKESMLRHLYDPAGKRWRDCFGSAACSQGTNALALRVGLTPDEDRQQAIAGLTADWECRTVLSLDLFRLLFEEGEEETAFRWLSRPDYPGWGYMIAQGAKTMWEGFEDKESHSHAWNGYPARLMTDYLLGIRLLEPGFRTIRIRPYFAPKLTYAKGKIVTVLGDVRVRWERQDSGILLYAEVPKGMKAELSVASSHPSSVLLGEGSHLFAIRDGQPAPIPSQSEASND